MKPTKRQELIAQLRHALHLAEDPTEEAFEFDIMETTFNFEDQTK